MFWSNKADERKGKIKVKSAFSCAYINMNLNSEAGVRKHYIKCQIVGEIHETSEALQDTVNRYYVNYVENILKKSNLSKEEKIRIINAIQENIKLYKEM